MEKFQGSFFFTHWLKNFKGTFFKFTLPKSLLFILGGGLLGLLAPIAGIITGLSHAGEEISVSNVILLHSNQPLIWIIDLTPFVLAFTSGVLGLHIARLQMTKKNLENIMSEQTLFMQNELSFFEALVANSPAAVAQLDKDYQIIDINPAFHELFGYSQVESLGRKLDQLVSPEDQIEVLEEITQSVSSGKIIQTMVSGEKKTGVWWMSRSLRYQFFQVGKSLVQWGCIKISAKP